MVIICFDPKHIGNAISVTVCSSLCLRSQNPNCLLASLPPALPVILASFWLSTASISLILSVSWSLVPALAGYLPLPSATSLWFVIIGFTFSHSSLSFRSEPSSTSQTSLEGYTALEECASSLVTQHCSSCSYTEATGICFLCLKGGHRVL